MTLFYNKKNSFTLIELLIVIFILGVLASLIASNFITSLKKGRDARRKADLEQIQRALEMYYEDKKAYPNFDIFQSSNYSLCDGEIAKDCRTKKVYMQKIPNDPLSGKSYGYDYDSTGSYYRLYACLENTQQILPYSSLEESPSPTFCTTQCKNREETMMIPCIWAVSSPNVNPY